MKKTAAEAVRLSEKLYRTWTTRQNETARATFWSAWRDHLACMEGWECDLATGAAFFGWQDDYGHHISSGMIRGEILGNELCRDDIL